MKTAMVLVAHADDESLGAGGLIKKLTTDGWDVHVVFLSDGRLTVRGAIEDNRQDAFEACSLLGTRQPVFLGYKDQLFDTYPIAEMANAVMGLSLAPDLIVTHTHTDLNLDHRIVLDIAKIVGRPKGRPISILGCEVPGTTGWNACSFPVNYYVDIKQTLEAKLEAFSRYKNEVMDFPHPYSLKGLQVMAEYHGMQSGLSLAEAFFLYRGFESTLP